VQLTEKDDERLVVERSGLQGKDERRVSAVGRVGEGPGHGESLPVEVVRENRGLAFRCPGGPHRGEEREPRLVFEDDPRVPASGVFFTTGQRFCAQTAMASGSPSSAFLWGR